MNVKNVERVAHSIAALVYVDSYWKVASYSPADAVRVSCPQTYTLTSLQPVTSPSVSSSYENVY